MKSKIFYPFIAAILTGFFPDAAAQDTTGTSIGPVQFEKLAAKKRTMVLDVRTPDEFRSGYIDHAANFNVTDSLSFISQVQTLNKKKKYLLYCKSGRRSGKALVIMKNLGFKKVYHLQGGVTDWTGHLNKPDQKNLP